MQAASPLPEQVRAVVDVLAGKGSHASQSLQSFIQTSNSQLYLHITVYGRQPAWSQRGGAAHVAWCLLEQPEVCTELGGGGSSGGSICASDGAISGTLLGKDAARGDEGSLPGLGDLSPGPSLPSAHLHGQPEESLMSSMSRSHRSVPAQGWKQQKDS